MKNKYKNVEHPEVHLKAKLGANLGDCIRGALMVCITEWRNVVFVHNDKTYFVNVNDLISQVKEK